MADIPMVYYYNGKNVEEMDKEELLEALKDAIKQIQWERDFHKVDRDMMETFAQVREREFAINYLKAYRTEMNNLAQKLGLT